MDVIDERFAVYTVVLVISSAVGALGGLTAAAATFGLLAVSFEAAYWVGTVLTPPDQSGA